jgi:hypothetical protein
MSKEVTTAREIEADGLHLLTTGRTDEAIAGRMTPRGTEIKLTTETIGRTLTGSIRGGTIVSKVVATIMIIGIGSQVSGGAWRSVGTEVIEVTGGVDRGKGKEGTEKEGVREGVGLGKKLAIVSVSAGKGHLSKR